MGSCKGAKYTTREFKLDAAESI